MTKAEWDRQGERLFGKDRLAWRFICPCCGYVASVQDYLDASAPVGAIGFSCVGRWDRVCPRPVFEPGPGPCDYAGGGLFGMNTVEVDGQKYFEFAEPAADQPEELHSPGRADRPDIEADSEAGAV